MRKPWQIRFRLELWVHILIIVYIISSPFLLSGHDVEFDPFTLAKKLFIPLSICIVYYLNYFWLIPRYLTRQGIAVFMVCNIVILLLMTFLHECTIFYFHDSSHHLPPPYPTGGVGPHRGGFNIIFCLRHFLSFAFTVLLAVVVSFSIKWKRAERARHKAELAMAEAELRNLKSQINPHFLLNTLNNIYALTEIDMNRARHVIERLGNLLRYMLYENQEKCVSLSKEVDAIRMYIDLMKIRLAKNVKVDFRFVNNSSSEVKIIPFLFMTLIENAFKHGIIPARRSFIDVSIIQTQHYIIFNCLNSCSQQKACVPKGGLGLKHVATQLEYYYPQTYKWVRGCNAKTGHYVSRIEIKLS